MTHYPYLDLAVMAETRDLVISASAAIIIDRDLTQIYWANGEGTKLLGLSQINDVLEADFNDHQVMKRQITNAVERLDAKGEHNEGDGGQVNSLMRIASGWKTRLVNFHVSNISLPDGNSAVLLVSEKLYGRVFGFDKMAASTISSLDGAGYVSAVLDEDGKVISASAGYAETGVNDALCAMLVSEVADENDRLVKRMVSTNNGDMAAGIAKLSDDPAIHLLILANNEEDHRSDEIEVDNQAEIFAMDNISTEIPDNQPNPKAPVSADDDETPPKAGQFSSRRPSLNTGDGGVGMERWYYRQPKPGDDDKPQSETIEREGGEGTDTEEKPVEHDVIDLRNQKTQPQIDLPLMTGIASTDAAEGNISGADNDEDEDKFRFTSIARPTRFVWHMDADKQFTSVSPEFAKVVGPIAANITGSKWEDISRSFGFDEDGSINARLNRGDTWSGKTVLWPVQGTDLRVPVDLAGLPSFNQDKVFSGYHGFGTVRTADSLADTKKTGLELIGQPASDEISNDEIAATDKAKEATPFTDDAKTNVSEKSQSPEHETSDVPGATIVNLTEQREARATRELSSGEQAAFEEIADKLNDDNPPETLPESSKETIDGHPPGSENENLETGQETAAEDVIVENITTGKSASTEKPNTGDAKDEGEAVSYLPSAFAGISSERAQNVDTSILLNLPIPVLIFKENQLLFSNQEFTNLTGYDDTNDLAERGGIEVLLGSPDGQNQGYTSITHKNGEQIAVKAHLQSVPWDRARALLLALSEESAPNEQINIVPSARKDKALEQIASSRPANFADISSRELSGILDTATDGVVVLTDTGEIRSLNRAAEALFGYEAEDVKGKEFTTLFAKESHRSARDYLAGLSGTGVASLLNDGRELIGKEFQGGLIPLFVTIGKLEESGNYCAVLRDITHWKKAEEDLVAARRQAELASDQKTDFLAKISHEIRTPLNAIIGFSEIMLEERFGKIAIDRYREYLRDINRSGGHVLELVNDLLDISKIEAGKLELDFSEVKLNDIIAEGVALTQPQANRDHIIIRTSLSGAVPPVVADPRSVRQIILNLVSNAIKYTKSGGQVIVSTVFEETGEVVLRVRDTGIGMTESEITTALMPFRRVQTIAHHQGEGTGLGLPLTKALVEANRAQFSIESTPGEGTLVEIYFPSTRVLTE